MVDTTEVSWLNNTIVRGFLGRALDGLMYWLLGLTYKIFFNVASAELFTNETIKNFYGRVQLILGVFMIFKLAVSIIKGIVNPDSVTDKSNGMGNLVTRIIFTLVMLTLIVPINIPNPQTEYDKQLNNNGLLFGTLYSFQNRILANNTVGRLILGTTDGMKIRDEDGSTLNNGTDEQLDKAANLFTSTILKGFIRINLKEGSDEDETNSDNWACPEEIDAEILKEYTNLTASPGKILSLTSLYCDAPEANWWQKIWGTNELYAFAYKWGISAIVGGIFVFIIVSFTIDVAVRAIKLAVLRLVAPIPIISYMDPNGQKKMFDSWVKNVTSTYIDLFTRLAIIYFVVFLVQDIIVNGLVVNQASGAVGVFTYIFIFIGLFVFAKQAPKFFRDLFGMKEGPGLFSGLGEMLGVGSMAAGAISGAATNYRSSLASDEALGRTQNRGRAALSAIAGLGAGGFAAGKAAFGAKDHAGRAGLDAAHKRNAAHFAAASDGSTVGGRDYARLSRMFTGQTAADVDQNYISGQKSLIDGIKARKQPLDTRRKANKSVLDFANTEAKKKAVMHTSTFKRADGTTFSATFAYNDLSNNFAAAKDMGSATFTAVDSSGVTHTLSTEKFAAEAWRHDKEAGFEYIEQYQAGAFGTNHEFDAYVSQVADIDREADGSIRGATLKANNEQLTGEIATLDYEIAGHESNISSRQQSVEFKRHAADDKATKPGGGK